MAGELITHHWQASRPTTGGPSASFSSNNSFDPYYPASHHHVTVVASTLSPLLTPSPSMEGAKFILSITFSGSLSEVQLNESSFSVLSPVATLSYVSSDLAVEASREKDDEQRPPLSIAIHISSSAFTSGLVASSSVNSPSLSSMKKMTKKKMRLPRSIFEPIRGRRPRSHYCRLIQMHRRWCFICQRIG